MLTSRQISDEELLSIGDPYQANTITNVHEEAAGIVHKRDAAALVAAPNPTEDEDSNAVREQAALDSDNESEQDVKLPKWKKRTNHLRAGMEQAKPAENASG